MARCRFACAAPRPSVLAVAPGAPGARGAEGDAPGWALLRAPRAGEEDEWGGRGGPRPGRRAPRAARRRGPRAARGGTGYGVQHSIRTRMDDGGRPPRPHILLTGAPRSRCGPIPVSCNCRSRSTPATSTRARGSTTQHAPGLGLYPLRVIV
jgi:hypothetical protein